VDKRRDGVVGVDEGGDGVDVSLPKGVRARDEQLGAACFGIRLPIRLEARYDGEKLCPAALLAEEGKALH